MIQDSKFKISLIMTSQDRKDDLDKFFLSLINQRINGTIELIFINQGTYNPAQNFTIPSFLTLRQIDIGHRIPLSKARNIGLQYVTGSIVAFPDDDCWYEPELLKKVTDFFCENPGVNCLCTNVFDPVSLKTYGNRPLGRTSRVSYINLFKLPTSAGIFCHAEALNLIGQCFDESLGAGTVIGSGEEIDLIARLLQAGMRIEYSGHIQVYHPVVEYVEADCLKYYHYGLGFGYLNGICLKGGHVTVMPYYGEMLMRSLLGTVMKMSSPVKRTLYWNRSKGIVKGLYYGMRGHICDNS